MTHDPKYTALPAIIYHHRQLHHRELVEGCRACDAMRYYWDSLLEWWREHEGGPQPEPEAT